jgi:hypothetical protein
MSAFGSCFILRFICSETILNSFGRFRKSKGSSRSAFRNTVSKINSVIDWCAYCWKQEGRNAMEQSSRKTNIAQFVMKLWNANVHYHIHKSPLLDLILNYGILVTPVVTLLRYRYCLFTKRSLLNPAEPPDRRNCPC